MVVNNRFTVQASRGHGQFNLNHLVHEHFRFLLVHPVDRELIVAIADLLAMTLLGALAIAALPEPG
jgi:hypothetical protein